MSVPVTVIDYGIGNQLNVLRALEHCGAAVRVVQRASAADLDAPRLVLPGVGAFGDAMAELRARGFDDLVRRFVQTGRPFLGICVGLQVLFERSEEMGRHEGLGLLRGEVRAVPATGVDGRPHRIPHIGWRPLVPAAPWDGTMLADAHAGDRVYFVHSFSAQPADPGVRLADVDYDGHAICAAVHRDNLHGCQFHPERSAGTGLAVLRRFLAL
ncbi:imidazole glycerol phosphate synthase subunit HisH [Ramlibacter sp.]|uniref:imidazole glycerol phosphate synthase subunit HisH n=1 Tax=Ramlibacter sp. TaxID=1917967 RepID=UPI002B568ED7|nr:imidazole glycerol phosphate synthase subunit HisH [Ramlibacter sp.]HWI81354.1 imidazole glycerol phosphate synthase subunit HisH [Ramlibacter sp.]